MSISTTMPKVCEHGIGSNGYSCKKCWNSGDPKRGRGICKHGKVRYRCLDTSCGGGGAMCKHNRRKIYCTDPECGGGSGICKHNVRKETCRDPACAGGSMHFCKHGIQRRVCRDPQCKGGTKYCNCDPPQQKHQCANCNPIGYITHRARIAVRHGLKRNQITKTKKTLDMLGLQTWEQFQSFWNKKIEQWNTAYPDNPITENYEIDHIKPVSALKQFVHGDMNHYTNLQPLPKQHNGTSGKGANWDIIDEHYWQHHVYLNPDAEIYIPTRT